MCLSVCSNTHVAVFQLEDHIAQLREELNRERDERNYFQLERDEITSYWKISERELAVAKAELRKLDKDIEEDEERHRLELKVTLPNKIIKRWQQHTARLFAGAESQHFTVRVPACSGVQAEDEAPLVRTPECRVGHEGRQLGLHRGPAERTGTN